MSVTQLLVEKNARPIRSLDELTADTFDSDHELDEFLAFTNAERHRDLSWSASVSRYECGLRRGHHSPATLATNG